MSGKLFSHHVRLFHGKDETDRREGPRPTIEHSYTKSLDAVGRTVVLSLGTDVWSLPSCFSINSWIRKPLCLGRTLMEGLDGKWSVKPFIYLQKYQPKKKKDGERCSGNRRTLSLGKVDQLNLFPPNGIPMKLLSSHSTLKPHP